MTGRPPPAAQAAPFRTRVGACWPGSRAVFRGADLHAELADLDWMELYVFGITGRRFAPAAVRLLHAIWVLTSYPDARLWNNRVAALAGSARSTSVLALSGAVAVTEAGIFGGGPGIRAIDFFRRAGAATAAGMPLRDFVGAELESRRIYGYGRPINILDERLPALQAKVAALGFDGGRHYRLAFEVERLLVEEHKPFLKMNYAAATAALAADLGFTPREYHLFNILKTLAGMPPCIVEAAEQPEGTVFATPCAGIAYAGPPPRPWPQEPETTAQPGTSIDGQ